MTYEKIEKYWGYERLDMFNYENIIVKKDLSDITEKSYIDFEKLRNATVLITGGNGMLATYIIYALRYLNEARNFNIRIIALVRNKEKAQIRLQGFNSTDNFQLINQDVCDEIKIDGGVEFIIHAAGSASPSAILNDPVGIIKANTIGTLNVLRIAKEKNIKNLLYTSTREIYGKIYKTTERIKESDYGYIDPLNFRSCYPESKRLAETLLKSFNEQYGVPFCIARLAHSYGPGMEINHDGRIMADLISNVVNNQNILLNSDGMAERAFCYISDAVAGLFLILLNGKPGEAYNLSNENEPIKIKDLAKIMTNLFPEKKLLIEYNLMSEKEKKGYVNFGRTELCTEKLRNLGWKPEVLLKEGILNTVKSFG